MASAVKNIFKESGTFLPNSEIIATANAISVAIGIPHPAMFALPKLNKVYNNAGRSIPPIAENIGKLACLMFANSPSTNSLFISKPTNKKNTDINTSFTIK